MCGRFYVSEAELDDFAALVEGIEKDLLKPRPNRDGTSDILPGDAAPVLVAANTTASHNGPSLAVAEGTSPVMQNALDEWQVHAPACGVRLLTWGFPGPGGKGRVINARAETVMEKPMFRLPFQGHRCIIPARGFYEWTDADNADRLSGEACLAAETDGNASFLLPLTGSKTHTGAGREDAEFPQQMTLDGMTAISGASTGSRKRVHRIRYRFFPTDGTPMAMAGLYWTFPLDAVRRQTVFTILTVAANADVSPLHDRMPLLLQKTQLGLWLRPGLTDEVRGLLSPPASGNLRCERSEAESA